jgi:simple sugar transport system permease protein
MGFQLAEIGLLTVAMMLTILIGGINLSIIAVANLAAVLAGTFLVKAIPQGATQLHVGIYLVFGLGVALLVGVISGVINGFLVGHIGVNSILATLATLSFFMGISTGLTGGETVTGLPDLVSVIGNEKVAGVPIPFLIFVALTMLAHIVLFRTPFGFKVRMLGTNPVASRFSGIDNKSIITKVYIMSGVYSAVAGILIMSRTMSAAYEYGRSYLLLTILITVLGGITPGFGSAIDIFVSVLTIQVLSTGFHMVLRGLQGSAFFKDLSYGVLLIVVMVIKYFTGDRRTGD